MIHNRLVLIDAYALIFRAFYSIPEHFSDNEGNPTNAVYGFTSALLNAIKELQPEYMAIGIDMGKSHRHADYGEYKAHRKPTPDGLKAQVPMVYEIAKALNIPIFGIDGFEGEDILATIVAKVKSRKLKVESDRIETILVTGDMDLLQMINEQTLVYSMARGASQAVLYDENLVKERYGVTPQQFVDLKALKGDASDNIPGVPGVGEKTAAGLIEKFGSLNELYEQIENNFNSHPGQALHQYGTGRKLVSGSQEMNEMPKQVRHDTIFNDQDFKKVAKKLEISEKVLKLLIENKDLAFLSQKLSRITDGAPIEFKLEDARVSDYNLHETIAVFEKLGFRSLIPRLPVAEKIEKKVEKIEEKPENKPENKQPTLF